MVLEIHQNYFPAIIYGHYMYVIVCVKVAVYGYVTYQHGVQWDGTVLKCDTLSKKEITGKWVCKASSWLANKSRQDMQTILWH